MSDLDGLLNAVVAGGADPLPWLILADWLDDHGQPERAELLRLHRRLVDTCLEPELHPDRAVWQARVVDLLMAGVEPCVPRRALPYNGVDMSFVWVPPGTFRMGSEEHDDETPAHLVTISRGFYLGTHPVTHAEWKAVTRIDTGNSNKPDRPADRVLWHDAQAYCRCVGRSSKAIRTGLALRLPTEAEWEYACRAGTATDYWSGDGEPALKLVGWYAGNSGGRSQRVAAKPPNPWGLRDLHGNVREWCQDRYGRYPAGHVTDPTGHRFESEYVHRGGSWGEPPRYCRSASRACDHPRSTNAVGFRVVLDTVR